MIDKNQFDRIADKYSHFSSWAIWADAGETPKSNIGDLRIFDIYENPQLLEQLKPEIIMVGLNFSRKVEMKPFGNFHDSSPQGQDYKIRFAFKGTEYYGAYMTDIIKNYEEKNSSNVAAYIASHPDFELENVEIFKQEIADLGVENRSMIALGNDAFNILNKHFSDNYRIVKVPHYSNYISQKDYKEKVEEVLSNIDPLS